MNETAQLAKFTAEMEFDKLPQQAVLMAKQCLLDWLGVALRGAHEEPARILRETALKMCGAGESTVFDGGSRRVDPVARPLSMVLPHIRLILTICTILPLYTWQRL